MLGVDRADARDVLDGLVALFGTAEASADQRRDDQAYGDEPRPVDGAGHTDAGGLVCDVDGHRGGVDHHHGPDPDQQTDDGADQHSDPAGADRRPVGGVGQLEADVPHVDLVDDAPRCGQVIGEALARHPGEDLRELGVVDDGAEDSVLHVRGGADQADDQPNQVLHVAAADRVELLVGEGGVVGEPVDVVCVRHSAGRVGGHCLCAPCGVADGMSVQLSRWLRAMQLYIYNRLKYNSQCTDRRSIYCLW